MFFLLDGTKPIECSEEVFINTIIPWTNSTELKRFYNTTIDIRLYFKHICYDIPLLFTMDYIQIYNGFIKTLNFSYTTYDIALQEFNNIIKSHNDIHLEKQDVKRTTRRICLRE